MKIDQKKYENMKRARRKAKAAGHRNKPAHVLEKQVAEARERQKELRKARRRLKRRG